MIAHPEEETQAVVGADKTAGPSRATTVGQARKIVARLLFAAIGAGVGIIVGFLIALFSGLIDISC
jgi:ABC-type microcin C transport system permease subunit YejE